MDARICHHLNINNVNGGEGEGEGEGIEYYTSPSILNEMERMQLHINPRSFQELEITCHLRMRSSCYYRPYDYYTREEDDEEDGDEDEDENVDNDNDNDTNVRLDKERRSDDNNNNNNNMKNIDNTIVGYYDPLNPVMDILITCWDQNQRMMTIMNDFNNNNNNNNNTNNHYHSSLLIKEQRYQFIPKDNLWIVQFLLTNFREHNTTNAHNHHHHHKLNLLNNNNNNNNSHHHYENSENSIMIQIQMFSAHQIYQHCFEVKNDINSILYWTINHMAKKQWKMEDIPSDIWDTIQEYVPVCFWTHGEPSLVINETDGQLDHMLTLPHGLLSTDWVWREGFFIENTFPKKIIRCAVKCETCEDFEGVFIPTEIRPCPNTSCMVWIDDDGEPEESYNEYYEKEEECSNNEISMYGAVYENSHSPYMCCAASPPYHPYMNNNATYMHMAGLGSFNHCGNISDSDSTLRDDARTPPPLGPLLSSNVLENHQNDEYDINYNWGEYDYSHTNIIPLTHVNTYVDSSSHNDYWTHYAQAPLPVLAAQGVLPIPCTTHMDASYVSQWPGAHTASPTTTTTTTMKIPKSAPR